MKTKKTTKKAVHARIAKKVVRHAPAKKVRKASNKRVSKPVKKAVRAKIAKVAPKEKAVVQDFRSMSIADEALINSVVSEQHFTNHVSRSVGKRAKEIIQLLAEPQTDDAVAEKLGIKINEVRRMLNTLNTFGVTRYNVNKDSKGWLTFKWYVDANKLKELHGEILEKSNMSGFKAPDGCNDFYICPKHYEEQRTIFPFETALEMGFKCECGTSMKQVNRVEVEQLVMKEGNVE
ncbi:MAG: hypothetical protein KGH49_00355 [Candidatus Micrarchaeota archaeon]|nr:hypothetical protein [Candidatus Micrarchaeota archaeon]